MRWINLTEKVWSCSLVSMCSSDRHIALKSCTIDLLYALMGLRASSYLRSSATQKTLFEDFAKLHILVLTDKFDPKHIKPLLHAALNHSGDAVIWEQARNIVAGTTRPILASGSQTPLSHTTSSVVNSAEIHADLDRVLKYELGTSYVGLPLYEKFFELVRDLKPASLAIFEKCTAGNKPLFEKRTEGGWSGWPAGAKEDAVLKWFENFIKELEIFAEECKPER